MLQSFGNEFVEMPCCGQLEFIAELNVFSSLCMLWVMKIDQQLWKWTLFKQTTSSDRGDKAHTK